MKIIDLAEGQRNNEILPRHIRYENTDLYFDGVSYYDEEGNNTILDVLSANNQALTHLYDKVEVIEEEKKIPEKIKSNGKEFYCDNIDSWIDKEKTSAYCEYLMNKYNDLIDYLESKEKGE